MVYFVLVTEGFLRDIYHNKEKLEKKQRGRTNAYFDQSSKHSQKAFLEQCYERQKGKEGRMAAWF